MDCNNNSNSKETKRDRLIVDDVSEITLEKILNFIYNGSIEFENDCVKILMAADCYQVHKLQTAADLFIIVAPLKLYHCQISSLKTVCEKFLTGQLSPSLVSAYLLVAEIANCQKLKASALKYCKLYKEYIYKVNI